MENKSRVVAKAGTSSRFLSLKKRNWEKFFKQAESWQYDATGCQIYRARAVQKPGSRRGNAVPYLRGKQGQDCSERRAMPAAPLRRHQRRVFRSRFNIAAVALACQPIDAHIQHAADFAKRERIQLA
jgi:hypothetical protein